MKKISIVAGAAVLAATASVASAEDSNPRGFLLASSCSGCHGAQGQGAGTIPPLNNLDKDYIATTMRAYKSGERFATVMDRLAKGYSDEEIDILAGWLAARQ